MATTFAKRIYKAATDFPGAHSTAWVQYMVEKNTIHVRMQAPEIMKEFQGSVEFGIDPKGILFFKEKEHLDIIGEIGVQNSKHSTEEKDIVIVESVFGTMFDKFSPFARFVARVDTAVYTIPDFNNKIGTGQMQAFEVATCHAQATRMSGNAMLNLGSRSILKQVYFKTEATGRISQSGTMFFTKVSELKTKPDGAHDCVADYTGERIVFHIANVPQHVVALFIPNKPMTEFGSAGTRTVKWKNIGGASARAAGARGGAAGMQLKSLVGEQFMELEDDSDDDSDGIEASA